jgi:hypothetical protein
MYGMLLSSNGFKYFLPGKAGQSLAKNDVGCEAEEGCGRMGFVHGEISGYDCRVAQRERHQLVSTQGGDMDTHPPYEIHES